MSSWKNIVSEGLLAWGFVLLLFGGTHAVSCDAQVFVGEDNSGNAGAASINAAEPKSDDPGPQIVQGGFGSGMGGGGMGGYGMGGPSAASMDPSRSQFAEEMKQQWRQYLADPIAIDASTKTSLQNLPSLIVSSVGDGNVFLDSRAILNTGVADPEIELPAGLSLGAALEAALEPHLLKAAVTGRGLIITADFAALARDGRFDSQWMLPVHVDLKTLDEPVSFRFEEIPLSDAVQSIGEMLKMPIRIDAPALEEMGLSKDESVSFHAEKLPARDAIAAMIDPLDLCLHLRHGLLMVTTPERAEDTAIAKIYFLEGTTGEGDFTSIMDLLQTSVEPETWEALGGTSTMREYHAGMRPALIISAPLDIHRQVAAMLDTIRQNSYGHREPVGPPQIPIFGGGGMGGGGMGGGGMF